jgi:amidase
MARWQELVADKQARQKASIPKDWLISVPQDTQLDVTSVPEQCGLLTEKEIGITNVPVDLLLVKLASAEFSAIEVVTAFSKRAIIAQQLVSAPSDPPPRHTESLSDFSRPIA